MKGEPPGESGAPRPGPSAAVSPQIGVQNRREMFRPPYKQTWCGFLCLCSQFVLAKVQNKNVSACEPNLNVGGVNPVAAVAPVTVKSHFIVFQPFLLVQSLSNQQQKQVKKKNITRWAKPSLNLFFRRPCNHCEFRGCWEKYAVFCRHSGVTTCQVKVRVRQKVPKTDALLFFSVVKARRSPQVSTQNCSLEEKSLFIICLYLWKIIWGLCCFFCSRTVRHELQEECS